MEELIESICDYVRKPYTDYAIMINGEWGSGKTYFWNNKLRSRLESIRVKDKKYKTIYMSLYGINSLEEISKKIFIETNPAISKTLRKFVDTREGNVIPEYVKTGLDMANLFGSTNLNSDKVDFSKTFAIDNKILCFDDLERANVDVIDILGYINNFVEHDGIKTILICNEKELATKFKNSNMELKSLIATYILDKEGNLVQKPAGNNLEDKYLPAVPLANLIEEKISDIFDRANDYERIKEKLIGETFEYIPEYAYILSGMIMKYSYNEPLADFYKRNTAIIIATFKKTFTRNLRILKHALNDFEKIFDNVTHDYPRVPKEVLQTMLIFTIAVSFEIKAGNISKEKLKLIKSNDEYVSIIFTSKILNDNNQFYLKEFDNRYFINTNQSYRFYKFIEVYIRTRYFDEKIYRENLQEIYNTSSNSKRVQISNYKKILNGDYWKLSDFDFDLLWRQVIEEVKLGKIDFDESIKLFAVYKYLINIGLVKVTVAELKHIFELGMQVAAKNNAEELFSKQFSDADNDVSKNGNEFDYEIADKDIEELKNKYVEIKNMALQELAYEKSVLLFKDLPSNIQEFYKKMINEYAQVPVFSKYDMEDLYAKLELTPNYDLYNIVNMLDERYKENGELFEIDSKNLKRLCGIIRKHRNDSIRSIKYVLLENIADKIEQIARRYKL